MNQRHTDCCPALLISGLDEQHLACSETTFCLAIIVGICHPVFHGERAVRLGDAPRLNSVEHGDRPQGRLEVRFLTFPPFSLTSIVTTRAATAVRQCL